MKKIIICYSVYVSLLVGGEVLTFIPADFEHFVTGNVTSQGQYNFRRYYEKLSKNMASEPLDQQRSTRHYFSEKALAALDSQHHAWYEQVNNFLTDITYLDQVYDAERE